MSNSENEKLFEEETFYQSNDEIIRRQRSFRPGEASLPSNSYLIVPPPPPPPPYRPPFRTSRGPSQIPSNYEIGLLSETVPERKNSLEGGSGNNKKKFTERIEEIFYSNDQVASVIAISYYIGSFIIGGYVLSAIVSKILFYS